MGKAKDNAVDAAPEVATPETTLAAVKTPAKKSDAPITVKYRNHIGEPVERTFSKEDHGEDFAAVADEFKATNADKLI